MFFSHDGVLFSGRSSQLELRTIREIFHTLFIVLLQLRSSNFLARLHRL